MRVGAGVRIDHRADEGANPILPLAVIADYFVAGDVCGGEGPMLEGVLIAARRPRALAVFSSVRILLGRSATCAAFGKIIVPCALWGPPPPSRFIWPAAATQFRLRQNAGRVRAGKSNRLHGAHYTPAQARAG